MSELTIITPEALWERHGSPTGEVILDKVVDFLRKSNTHSVEDVAIFFDVAPRHLSGAIQILTGIPLKELMQEWRIRQALDLLDRQPELSVADIAHRCGYRSDRNLTRDFLKRFNTTPYVYRSGEVRRNGNYPMNESAALRNQVLQSALELKRRQSAE